MSTTSTSPTNQIPPTTISTLPPATLSTAQLFNHFFLIHDFLFRLVKNPSSNSRFFDLQMQINDSMRQASKMGGKGGQMGTLAALALYCMKGNSIKLKLLGGFLYMYWVQHWYTLGSYLGLLIKMPNVYNITAHHFLQNQPLNPQTNLFLRLHQQITTNPQYQQTQPLLNWVFKQQITEEKTYLSNEFFVKNKDKYFSSQEGTLVERPNLKLKYMDCFLTRYVYYSFARWYHKKMKNWGLAGQEF